MSEENKNLPESGNGISPKHFVYLDRNRLFSYTAQVSDGLPQLRRLLESINHSTIDNPNEKYAEELQELSNEAEGSVGAKGFVGAVGKRTHKKSQKKGAKEGGSTSKYESLQTLSQDKAEHDNLYLLLEQDLMDAGQLREIDSSLVLSDCPSLIKVRGTARFFDWEPVIQFMENPDDIWNVLDQNGRQSWGGNKNKLKGLARLIKMFYPGPLTLNMQVGALNLSASLDPRHLCMTLDQLRAAYVMPGDVEITIVGFTPRRPTKPSTFPGVAGGLDMSEIWQNFMGQVDLVVDPLAIYGETI